MGRGKILWADSRGIIISSPDGSNQQVVVTETAVSETFAVFSPGDLSPDGSKVLLQGSVSGVQHSGDIYVVAAAGGTPSPVSHQIGAKYSPRWSPDGTKIAFYQWSVTSQGYDVWVMNADGTNGKVVASGGMYPYWSPDGKTLVFSATSSSNSPNNRIARVNADGTGRGLLGPITTGFTIWSPDGAELASQGQDAINIERPDGTLIRSLPVPAGYVLQDWDPDSRRLLVAVGNDVRAGPYTLMLMDASSGAVLGTVATNVFDYASWQRPIR